MSLAAAHPVEPDLEYLLRARRALPALFTDASEHNVALGRVAREVSLMRTQFFEETARRRYVTITVSEGGGGDPVRHVDPDRVPALARDFRRCAALAADGADLSRPRVIESLARALRDWHEIRDAESERTALTWLRFAIWSEVVPRLDRLTPILNDADVAVFENAGFFESAFHRVRAEIDVSRRRHRDLDQALRWLHRRARLDLLRPDSPGAPRTTPFDQLTLAELNPELGALRGHPGSDCSSTAGPGFAYSPDERVFLILDQRGRARGYASTTRLRVGQETRLYVNAIAGKRLKPRHVLMTLGGLQSFAVREGLAGLALPTAANLWTCINYAHLRETLQQLIVGRPERHDVTFLAAEARSFIEMHSAKGYEAMRNNRGVVPIPPPPAAAFKIEVGDGSRFGIASPRPSTRDEFATGLVEWLANGRERDDLTLRGMYLLAGVDVTHVARVVNNSDGRRRDEYLRLLEIELGNLGVPEPARLPAERAELFALGEIMAADALEPARRFETFARLIRFVQRQRAPLAQLLPPRIESWLKELAPSVRDELLVQATDRLLEKEFSPESRRVDVGVTLGRAKLGHLIGRLLDGETLRRRAPELVHLGLPWRGLMAIAGYLDQDLNEIHLTHGAIIGAALGHAPTAAEFNARLRDLLTYLGSTYTPSHDAVHGCLLHLMSLRPTVAEVERTWDLLGRPAAMMGLLRWLTREFRSAAEFARDLPIARGTDLAEMKLVAGVIDSRVDEFHALNPTLAQIALVERALARPDEAHCESLLKP